jgi:hypothetical protein
VKSWRPDIFLELARINKKPLMIAFLETEVVGK